MKLQIVAQALRYTAPTLLIEIIHGTEDVLVSPDLHAKTLAKEAQNSNLTLIEGIGHMPHHVAQQDVIDAIERAALRSRLC